MAQYQVKLLADARGDLSDPVKLAEAEATLADRRRRSSRLAVVLRHSIDAAVEPASTG